VLAEGPLASTPGRLDGVSVQEWTPTLIPASSDVDANFSDLHAQQSCKLLKQVSGRETLLNPEPEFGLSPLFPSPLQEEKRGRKTLERKAVRKPILPPSNPTLLELDLKIYCDKEEAGAKEKASPSSPCCGAHPRTRRKVTLEALLQLSWDCPRRSSPSHKSLGGILERQPWLPVDDVEARQLATTSRGVMSRRSNRPQHREALCFPHHRQWTMEYSCKVWCKPCRRRSTLRQHSRPSWRPRQEGEMEQYLEEKKASQKRPAATFQRQDKRKTVYQTPQKSVAVSNSQVPSVRSPGAKKECPYCGKTHGGSECWLVAGVVGDVAPLEEAAETDSECGD
ncbi:hypothetical protein Taro_007296, partial [Colocasia esculenta]|nr:hypothetical protein [Colocasia esculenta]